MGTHEENQNRSLGLLSLGCADCWFHLFAVTWDETGVRISLCEIILGERAGALLGFQWASCPDCGRTISMDLFWTGLFYG